MALPQMLKSNQHLDKLAAARVDFATRGMLADSCFVQAIKEAAMDCEDDCHEHANSLLVSLRFAKRFVT